MPKQSSSAPPPAGFNPPAGQPAPHQNVVVVQPGMPTVYAVQTLPKVETRMACPSCHATITTKVQYTTTTKTHMWAVIMCCCLCWPCAWLPYVMKSCKNANHSCPECGSYIGTALNL